MFDVSYTLKDFFFDENKVVEQLTKAERKAMAKIGAHIRRSARSSMRRRKSTSSPGSPPSVHSSDKVATLKNVLFAYEPMRHSVVVGPVRLNQQNSDWINAGSITIPKLMEAGGVVAIREERWKSTRNKEFTWFRRDMRRRVNDNKEYRTRRAVYEPRPFMGPALERERESNKLIDAWRAIL